MPGPSSGPAAIALGTLLLRAEARRHAGPPASLLAELSIADTAIPDDLFLMEQLRHAVDLRSREHFDRVLDARDPGELVEHATLSEVALDRKVLGIDTLFIVGDELFGYAFRPENGWGAGGTDRNAVGHTPRLRRITSARRVGPTRSAAFSRAARRGAGQGPTSGVTSPCPGLSRLRPRDHRYRRNFRLDRRPTYERQSGNGRRHRPASETQKGRKMDLSAGLRNSIVLVGIACAVLGSAGAQAADTKLVELANCNTGCGTTLQSCTSGCCGILFCRKS